MIIINKNNYELFAIDYLENNLDAQTRNAFEVFLAKYPAIRAEIEELCEINIAPEDIIFENKTELKKSPLDDLSYFEYLAISDVEGTISRSEKKELQYFLTRDNNKFKEYQLFSNSVLIPEKVLFPNKSKLKKSKIFNLKNLQRAVTSVAAVILIFIAIKFIQKDNYFFFTRTTAQSIQESFAQTAVYSQFEILSIRKVVDRNIVDIKKNEHRNTILNNKKNYLAKNRLNIPKKNDTIRPSLIANNNNAEIDADIPLNHLNFALNKKQLPEIKHILGKQNPSYRNKNSFFASIKKINAVDLVNFAFKGFDIMTESNLNMKLKVSNSRKIKIDIRGKNYILALK